MYPNPSIIRIPVLMTRAVLEIPCLHIEENTLSLFRNLIAFEQTCPEFGNDQLRCDEEVSTLFTELRKDVVLDFDGEYYLKSMSSALEACYQGRLNRWLALGVFAATIVLFCTLVQTLIAVLSYVKLP
uniref:Uncharacterized protein n=1 Tax=Ananas comosus var. bracteatus TaxID=296719 RepID=A0A6V7PVN8_ANACO|nr:unnamed protein product [Ananas comosus var. bracteatus]